MLMPRSLSSCAVLLVLCDLLVFVGKQIPLRWWVRWHGGIFFTAFIVDRGSLLCE